MLMPMLDGRNYGPIIAILGHWAEPSDRDDCFLKFRYRCDILQASLQVRVSGFANSERETTSCTYTTSQHHHHVRVARYRYAEYMYRTTYRHDRNPLVENYTNEESPLILLYKGTRSFLYTSIIIYMYALVVNV